MQKQQEVRKNVLFRTAICLILDRLGRPLAANRAGYADSVDSDDWLKSMNAAVRPARK